MVDFFLTSKMLAILAQIMILTILNDSQAIHKKNTTHPFHKNSRKSREKTLPHPTQTGKGPGLDLRGGGLQNLSDAPVRGVEHPRTSYFDTTSVSVERNNFACAEEPVCFKWMIRQSDDL
jgi:hypothetical protein